MSTHDTTDSTIRVVILGGGYAGVIATNRFLGSLSDDERSRVELSMVNPQAGFVERIRLHQLVAGSRACVTIPLTDVLHPDAALVTGTATHIDHCTRTVRVSTAGREVDLGYDYLVYAVGSRAAASIPGVVHVVENAPVVEIEAGGSASAAVIGTRSTCASSRRRSRYLNSRR